MNYSFEFSKNCNWKPKIDIKIHRFQKKLDSINRRTKGVSLKKKELKENLCNKSSKKRVIILATLFKYFGRA